MSNFETAPHFSGRVEIEGPVEIRDSLECTSINGLDVPHFPKLLVMKDMDQTITGMVLLKVELKVLRHQTFDYLNRSHSLHEGRFSQPGRNRHIERSKDK